MKPKLVEFETPAPAPDLSVLDSLDLRDTKRATSKVERGTIKGLDDVAARYAARAAQIEDLESQQKQDAQALRAAALDSHAVSGLKTFSVGAVDVQIKDQFTATKAENEPAFRSLLGRFFDRFFVRTVRVKLADEVSADDLRNAIGTDAYAALSKYLAIEETIHVVKGFSAAFVTCKPLMNETEIAATQKIIGGLRYAPSIKVRGGK